MSSSAEKEGVKIDNVFSGLEKKLVALFTIDKAADFVKNVVNIRGQFQQLEVAFTTLLKSEDKANKLMSEAVDLAAKTPFDLQGVASGARQLLAYGFEAENVMDVMRRLGDVAAGLGLPLERLTYLYGTTRVQGRLYARDMLQFTNSGIPLLDELAKMYDKTTAEINDMVSAGKIGFSDVEKVIRKMTDAGGQFDNLMAKQSKTITGQISNIKDAIDVMFNEIGKKNEGFINTALSGVSLLVENYEKIGRILGDTIIVFGSYKAAVMLLKAVELAEAKAAIAANAGVSASYLTRIAALRKLVAAQQLLNKTMLNNPYVLAATAISAATVGLFRWAKEADKGTAGTKKFNSYVEEQTERLEENRQKVEECLALAADDTRSNAERRASIAKLIDIYPEILEQYGNEANALEHILEIKKLIAAQDLQDKWNEDSAKMDELQGKLKNINEAIAVNERSAWGGQAIQSLRNYKKELEVEIGELQKKMDEYSAPFYNGPEKPSGSPQQVIKKSVADIEKEITESEKKMNDLRAKAVTGLSDTEQQSLMDLEEAIKKSKAEYKAFTGKEFGQQANTAAAGIKNVEDVARAQFDLDKKRLQSELDVLQQGKDAELSNADEILKKKLQLIDLEEAYKQAELDREIANSKDKSERLVLTQEKEILAAIAEIDRAEARGLVTTNYEQSLNNKISSYQTYAGKRKAIDEQLRRDLKLLEDAKKKAAGDDAEINDAIEGVKRQMFENSGLAEFETYEEKRGEIQKKYQDLRNQAEAEGNAERLRLIIEGEKNALSALDAEELMASSTWSKLFTDLGGLTAKEVADMISKVEAQLGSLKLSPIDYKTVVDNLDRAKNEIANKNPFGALKVFWDDYQKSQDKATKAKAIDGIRKSFDSIGGSLTTAGGALSNMFDSFGNEELGEGIGTACDLLGEMGTAAGGVAKIMSGDILGGISDIITGLANIVTIFNQIHDKKLQKEIEADQKIIDRLKDAYDELSEAVSKSFGKNASAQLDEMNSKLLQQIALIEDQKRLEEDKKKTDEDAIDSYNEQIADIRKTIEDNKAAAIDAILGEDIQSSISNFSAAITDAWAKGKGAAEGAKEHVKKMLQDTITESVKAYIQASKAMERIRQTMLDAMADDLVTEEEKNRIEQQAQALADEVEKKFGWANKFYQDDEQASAREAATKNSLGSSQESVDESNGRLTAIQGKADDISVEQKVQTGIISDLRAQSASILDEVMGIHDDTSFIRNAVGDIHSMTKEIKSGVSSITDRGVKML